MTDTDKADQPRTGGAPRRWSFGAVAFDERSMQLFIGGRAVELELKPLEVLRYLLQHPGEAVSKDDLVKAVWPGRVISDSALTSTIAKLREALGPEWDAVHTVHGFGYRLDAQVRAGVGTGVAAEADSSPAGRRLTAIMFTDLVGYSALAHRDEPLAIELLELHRGWVREILPRHGGREIETIGDAFLVEFSGALAAVECAVAIQRRFAEHNAAAPEGRRMQLRIGIHAGDVEHKEGKVMGDGVNVASRIHGLAEPGGICVSEDVQRAVRPHGYRLASLGTPALKNIATPLELYRVRLDDAPLPALRRRWMGAPPRWLAAVAAGAVIVGLAIAGYLSRAPRGEMPPPSVAVLPFENLSGEEDSIYFTDGLHDSVIGHLSRIEDLKVISRTSVMGYRDKKSKLEDVARELGVDHIVEGSVQRAGGRLRVAVQLIDAATDAHMWSNEYDRELADVFAVQADIARQVAATVHAKLTPRAEAAIERVPTTNQEAYDLYLRALVTSRKAIPARTEQESDDAIAKLERAVALDPQFALAYAELAHRHATAYWYSFDPSDGRREQVRLNVEAALRLAPDLAEAHVANALFFYQGWRKYEEAQRELEVARELAPGNASVHYWLGMIHRRQSRWDEALVSIERAVTLDPLHGRYIFHQGLTLEYLGRFTEADWVYGRLQALGPDPGTTAVVRANLRMIETGDVGPLTKALEGVQSGYDPGCQISMYWWVANVYRRKLQEAASGILACAGDFAIIDARERIPTEFLAAAAYDWAGETALAQKLGERARARLAQSLEEDADQPVTRMNYAYTLLMLGQREAALVEGDRALEQMPVSRDALVGADLLKSAALFHAAAGETERSLDELERALALPAGLHAHEARLHPGFDPLRNDPRFQKLLAEHLPKNE